MRGVGFAPVVLDALTDSPRLEAPVVEMVPVDPERTIMARWISTERVELVLPPSWREGTYSVRVETPAGEVAELTGALVVMRGECNSEP